MVFIETKENQRNSTMNRSRMIHNMVAFGQGTFCTFILWIKRNGNNIHNICFFLN